MKFSVLMAVYYNDNSKYFAEALESLANQTLKADEVILVEDGVLTNELHSIIEHYRNKLNIVTVSLNSNNGLAKALNEGIKYCKYDYIARMDSDDICLNNRFEKQIKFLRNNKDIDVLSGWINEYDEDMKTVLYTRKVPRTHTEIMKKFKIQNQINHVAVFYKKESVLQSGGYPSKIKKAQDYCLWSSMVMNGAKFANLQENLVNVRTGTEFFERRGLDYLKYEIEMLKFQHKLGFLSKSEYYMNYIIRFVARSMPSSIKRLIYQVVRK